MTREVLNVLATLLIAYTILVLLAFVFQLRRRGVIPVAEFRSLRESLWRRLRLTVKQMDSLFSRVDNMIETTIEIDKKSEYSGPNELKRLDDLVPGPLRQAHEDSLLLISLVDLLQEFGQSVGETERRALCRATYRAGFLAFKFGDFSEAVRLFEKLLATCQEADFRAIGKNKVRALLDLGTSYLFLADSANREGNLRKGLERLRQAVTEDPGLSPAWYNLGWVQDELGQYREAVESNLQALRADPRRGAAWQNIICAQIKMRDLATAMETLRMADAPPGVWRDIDDDPEIAPLKAHPQYGSEARALIEARKGKVATTAGA